MRVFSVLQQAIAAPVFPDEQKTRLATLLHRVTLGLAAIAIVFIILTIIFFYTPLSLCFGLAVLGLCLLTNLITRQGYIRSASLILSVSMWLIFSVAAITGEGVGVFDASFTGYIIPITIAGYLISGQAGLAFAFLSIAAGGLILAAQLGSGTNSFPLPRSMIQWAGQSVVFVAAAYLLALTRSSMMDALGRAQKGEQQLNERNAELQGEILKRQHIEDNLRQQYNRLRGAFSAAGLDTWVWDARIDVLSYPDTDPETAMHYPTSMKDFLKLVHPDDVEGNQRAMEAAILTGAHYETVYRYFNPNGGKEEWYYAHGDAYFDADGKIAGLSGAVIDITQRKVAEEGLHASEAAARAFQDKLKALHEVSVELAQTQSLDELYRKAIQLGRDKLGFGRLGLFLLGDNPSLVVGTYGIDANGQIRSEQELNFPLGNNQMVMEALQSRSHVSVRYDIELWDNGSVVGRGWNAMALLWNKNNAIGWLASDNLLDGEPLRADQLELLSLYGSFLGPLILKKKAEMEAQGHQQRLRLALKAAQMRTWNWNLLTDEIIADEPELFNLRRATRAEDFYRQVYADDHALIRSAIERATQENVPYVAEYRILDANNGIRWISALGQVYRDESGTTAIVGVSQDITERKQAEERFFKAFHANPSAIAITTVDEGRYIEVNRAWGELLGFTREESIGRTSVEVGFIENLKARASIINEFDKHGYIHDLELLVGGKNGKKVLILLQAEQIDLDGKTCFLTMLQDISGRKEAEKQTLELALEKERVALLTEFMGNMSHDIKTPLTAINNSLYLLERTDDAAKQREKLTAIRTQTRLLERFIQDILTISRLDYAPALELKAVRLNHLLEDIALRLRPATEKKSVQLQLELEPDSTPVLGDDDELDRVLVNLVENAVNYTPAGGIVRVCTFVDQGHLVIEVIDTGIGIDPADITNIFNRFYRAESARSAHNAGTGLGLAIVQKIVSMHNGTIEVDSVVGQGSTFRIRLPLAS